MEGLDGSENTSQGSSLDPDASLLGLKLMNFVGEILDEIVNTYFSSQDRVETVGQEVNHLLNKVKLKIILS